MLLQLSGRKNWETEVNMSQIQTAKMKYLRQVKGVKRIQRNKRRQTESSRG